MSWDKEELVQIAAADDLHIAPLREDGQTLGTPTWIWSVAVGGDLYVRAYNGQNSRWYKAAKTQKAGRITAAGMTKDVIFEAVDGDLNNRVDEAYRAKYSKSPCREAGITEEVHHAFTGHSGSGVGRSYGRIRRSDGVMDRGISLKRLKAEIDRVAYDGLVLPSWQNHS